MIVKTKLAAQKNKDISQEIQRYFSGTSIFPYGFSIRFERKERCFPDACANNASQFPQTAKHDNKALQETVFYENGNVP